MNFETMSKQRKMMLIAAAIGVIAMFLPWLSYFGFSVSGMHGWGILVFLCFAAAAVMAFKGNQTQNLNQSEWTISLIVAGLAALIMVIYFLTNIDVLRMFGFGFYLALIASVALLAVTYMHRSAGHTLQSGFDHLKQNFDNKSATTHTGGTTTTTTTNVSHTTDKDSTRLTP